MTDRGHAPFEILVSSVEARRYGSAAAGVDPAGGVSLVEWADHLSTCTRCQEQMREIDKVMASIREGDAGDAPDIWIERARRRTVPASYLEPLRGDLQADVVFDSAHQRLTGSRSGSLDSRQLLFAWNRLEVELYIGAGGGSPWNVSGQIFAHEGAPIPLDGLSVELTERERDLEQARTSASGEFLFGTRPKGPFRLRIAGDGWTLSTPEIEP